MEDIKCPHCDTLLSTEELMEMRCNRCGKPLPAIASEGDFPPTPEIEEAPRDPAPSRRREPLAWESLTFTCNRGLRGSLTANALGAITGSSQFPALRFPQMCVCCGKVEHLVDVPAAVFSAGSAENASVKACEECKGHAVLSRFKEARQMVCCVAGAIGIWQLREHNWEVGVSLTVAAAAGLWWEMRDWFAHPERRYGTGHGGPLWLTASPGSLRVGTYNEALVRALRSLNSHLL